MSRAEGFQAGEEYGDPKGSLSVDDLIAKLAELPRDAKVVLEGCDCWGVCVDAESRGPGYVLLRRAP